MTTVNTTIVIWCEWIKIIPLIRLAKKNGFLVCRRILVISLCVPWDEKGWKLMVYYYLYQGFLSLSSVRAFSKSSVSFKKSNWFKNSRTKLWLLWLSGLSASLQTKGLPVQFPVRAHAWVAGRLGACERQPIDTCLAHKYFSPFLSPSLPLKNK